MGGRGVEVSGAGSAWSEAVAWGARIRPSGVSRPGLSFACPRVPGSSEALEVRRPPTSQRMRELAAPTARDARPDAGRGAVVWPGSAATGGTADGSWPRLGPEIPITGWPAAGVGSAASGMSDAGSGNAFATAAASVCALGSSSRRTSEAVGIDDTRERFAAKRRSPAKPAALPAAEAMWELARSVANCAAFSTRPGAERAGACPAAGPVWELAGADVVRWTASEGDVPSP